MPTFFKHFLATLCLFTATVVPFQPMAQDFAVNESVSDQNGLPVIETRLTPSHIQATPGETINLAWEFKLQPEWHIYWKNAGDSGIPPELKAEQGTLSDLTYPVPHVISIPPITNYGYENAVTFTTSYTVPTDLPEGNQSLAFSGNFLYCKDICMPGTVRLNMPLGIGNESQTNPDYAPVQNLPQTLSGEIQATINGNIAVLSLPQGTKAANAHFIPDEDGIIDDSAPQPSTGSQLTIQLDEQAQSHPQDLKGLLLLNGKGYVINTPFVAGSTSAPSTGTSLPQTEVTGLVQAFVFALLAGIILNLMPCVLPVLSLKVLSLIKHHHGADKTRHTLAYTTGVITSFLAFGLVIALLQKGGNQLGWGFHLQNPLFVAALVFLMLTMALQFFGVFELGHSLTRLGGLGSKREKLASSFSTGVLAVVVATPCTVPFMGGAMAYALAQPVTVSLAVFAALGLGMALPFLLAAFFPILLSWLPKPGAWMSTFRHALGWPMLLTGVWLLYVFANQTSQWATFMFMIVLVAYSFTLWLYGVRSHLFTALLAILTVFGGLMLINASLMRPIPASWQEWSSEKVSTHRQEQPVFVDFTADWCITCKVTEATVLNTASVQTLFAQNNTLLLKADWTKQNPAITQELERHGRRGVPLYLLYLPGEENPRVLPQLLTYSTLQKALEPQKENGTN